MSAKRRVEAGECEREKEREIYGEREKERFFLGATRVGLREATRTKKKERRRVPDGGYNVIYRLCVFTYACAKERERVVILQ